MAKAKTKDAALLRVIPLPAGGTSQVYELKSGADPHAGFYEDSEFVCTAGAGVDGAAVTATVQMADDSEGPWITVASGTLSGGEYRYRPPMEPPRYLRIAIAGTGSGTVEVAQAF